MKAPIAGSKPAAGPSGMMFSVIMKQHRYITIFSKLFKKSDSIRRWNVRQK
jgi:hypothetical protein